MKPRCRPVPCPPAVAAQRPCRSCCCSALFALFLLGVGIGLRDPWPSDEPRFALVARWMVEHGQWLFPHRGHELYPDKPPVFMWMQALAYFLTRSWRVAFLLPSLAAGAGRAGAGLRPGAATVEPPQRTAGRAHPAGDHPLHLPDAQCADRPAAAGLDHAGQLRPAAAPAAGPVVALVLVGCFFAGVGVVTKGVGVLALLMLIPYRVRAPAGMAAPGSCPTAAGAGPAGWRCSCCRCWAGCCRWC